MRVSLCLFIAVILSSSAAAQTLPFKMFGKSKASGETEAGPITRQMALARLSERHGHIAQAVKIYNQVLTHDPGNHIAHHRLGILETQRGQLEQAMKHFAAAAQDTEPTTELLNDIGYACYLADKMQEAEVNLVKALRVDPSNKAAMNNLGLVLAQQGRFEEGFSVFRRAGSEANAHANLAYLYAQSGHLKEAEASYHHALNLDRNLRPAAQALLQVVGRKQELEQQASRGRSAAAELAENSTAPHQSDGRSPIGAPGHLSAPAPPSDNLNRDPHQKRTMATFTRTAPRAARPIGSAPPHAALATTDRIKSEQFAASRRVGPIQPASATTSRPVGARSRAQTADFQQPQSNDPVGRVTFSFDPAGE